MYEYEPTHNQQLHDFLPRNHGPRSKSCVALLGAARRSRRDGGKLAGATGPAGSSSYFCGPTEDPRRTLRLSEEPLVLCRRLFGTLGAFESFGVVPRASDGDESLLRPRERSGACARRRGPSRGKRHAPHRTGFVTLHTQGCPMAGLAMYRVPKFGLQGPAPVHAAAPPAPCAASWVRDRWTDAGRRSRDRGRAAAGHGSGSRWGRRRVPPGVNREVSVGCDPCAAQTALQDRAEVDLQAA